MIERSRECVNFFSTSQQNSVGLADRAVDEHLSNGLVSQDPAERKDEFEAAFKGFVQAHPGIWYLRTTPSYFSQKNVPGLVMIVSGPPPVRVRRRRRRR